MIELSIFNVATAFFTQLIITVGAVVLSIRVGMAKLEVKLDDVVTDVLRVEQKVDKINGNVRSHDRELAGLQKEVEQLQRTA